MSTASVHLLRRVRLKRERRRAIVIGALLALIAGLFVASLVFGHVTYSLGEVWGALTGNSDSDALFTVGHLRFPRAVMGLVAGMSFGLAGSVFQTMLRNPLASPDIIGISTAASAGAVFAIVMLGWQGFPVKVTAVIAALAVALAIYSLSAGRGAGTRLILIGIGVGAMFEAVISFVLQQAPQWDLQEAMRWLTGSLNGTNWGDVGWTAVALVVCGPVVLAWARNLSVLELGDDMAGALGARAETTRLVCVCAAVGLVAFATAGTGPIAFVAFLAGPIAKRLLRGAGSVLLPAALVGAALVLGADLAGQTLFTLRYPVGVITGALGAPYLVYLIIRTNQGRAS